MDLLADIDWTLVLQHIRDIAYAYILALPIGWNRERSERSAGLRTFPLVAVAACGYMLTGFEVLTSTDAEARVMEGIITGMGFIGGGAILKNMVQGEGFVQGTATAASLWATGAIGLAVAASRLEIAIVISILTFATLTLLTPRKRTADTSAG